MTGALLKADMAGLGCDILLVVTDISFTGRKAFLPLASNALGGNDQV